MSEGRRGSLINPRERLPDVELPRLESSRTKLPLRAGGRASRVLLLLHGNGCRRCAELEHRLAERRSEIEAWDGRVLVAVAGAAKSDTDAAPSADNLERPFPVVVDADRRLRSALSVDAPTVVVADQWGVIHLLEEGGEHHRFPEPDEVVASVRYLAIECPECQGEAL